MAECLDLDLEESCYGCFTFPSTSLWCTGTISWSTTRGYYKSTKRIVPWRCTYPRSQTSSWDPIQNATPSHRSSGELLAPPIFLCSWKDLFCNSWFIHMIGKRTILCFSITVVSFIVSLEHSLLTKSERSINVTWLPPMSLLDPLKRMSRSMRD